MKHVDVATGVMLLGIMLALYTDSLIPLLLYVGAMLWLAQEDILAAWRRLWD